MHSRTVSLLKDRSRWTRLYKCCIEKCRNKYIGLFKPNYLCTLRHYFETTHLEVFHERQLIMAEVKKFHFRNQFLWKKRPEKSQLFIINKEITGIYFIYESQLTTDSSMQRMKFRLMSRVVSIFHVGMIAVTGQSVSTPSGSHCANSDASGTKISCRRRSVHCHSHDLQWQWKGKLVGFKTFFGLLQKAKQLRQKLKTLQPFNVGVGDMTKLFFSWYETFYLMITI